MSALADPVVQAELALHEIDGAADVLDRVAASNPFACAHYRDAMADLGHRLIARASDLPKVN